MKKTSLWQLYRESFKFIKQIKGQIFLCVGIFIFMIFIGFFISPSAEIELQILEQLKQMAIKFEGLNIFQTTWEIFSNNVYVSFLSIVLGIFLGIVPLLISIFNGYIIGFVVNRVSDQEGLSILWQLLPHGIFEIPAIMISVGLGLTLGSFMFKEGESRKNIIKNVALSFILIVVPLLIIAAIIEGMLIFYLS